jgi:TonB family protein
VDSHATSAPDTGTAFGQYDLIELVATGGMAEVFKARMRGLGGFQKIVAIKRILPHLTENDEFVTMFVDEAKLAAGLQHPNIIHIYDLGKLERSYYIAMEYIDGNDLRSILRLLKDRGRHLPLGIAIYIASRLGAALDYAHRKRDLQGREMKLVHRDVSPQNVLISYDGDIKLCDFGIAKAASKASHTRAGALKGKLQYMSPEQAWAKDIDLRSDIFSLGLVLYEMLTGRKAFTGDSELSVLELVRSPQIVPPRDLQPAIPPEVERIVLRALQENRDDRYQTAADFVADLDGIMQNLRPAPDARELGSFLADLMGKETLVSQQPVPSPRPAVAAPTSVAAPTAPKPKPAPRPAPPAFAPAAPHPVVLEPRRFEVEAAPKRRPIGLIAGVVVVALATVAGVLYLMRDKQPIAAGGTAVAATPAAPVETPAPEGGAVGLSPVAAPPQAEGGEAAIPAPTAVPTRVRPTVPAGVQLPAAPPTRTAVTTTPALAPAAPTPAPTEAPLLVPATPTPAPQLTRAPEAEPTPTAIVAIAVGPTTPATVVKRVTPVYPKLAERQRVKGTVELRFTVTEAGAVEDIEVTRNTVKPDLGCGKAAIDAARQWRFNPATRDGSPVRTKGSAVFNFGF